MALEHIGFLRQAVMVFYIGMYLLIMMLTPLLLDQLIPLISEDIRDSSNEYESRIDHKK